MPPHTVPSLIQKKIIPAPRLEVFEAWTNPEIMQRWFFPPNWSSAASIDLRVGGHWKNDMIDDGSGHNGKDGKRGQRYAHFGEYLEIKPPEKLVFTWNSHKIADTRVTIELKDLGDKTELTLTHEFFRTDDDRAAHDGGWTVCLASLERYFSN